MQINRGIMKKFLALTVLLASSIGFSEEELNTQFLKPEDVGKAVQLHDEAKRADQAVDAAAQGNPEFKKQIYEISQEMMPWLIEQAHGDEAKMKEIVDEAARNPELFMKRLPASIQGQVTDVSSRIDQAKRQKPIP